MRKLLAAFFAGVATCAFVRWCIDDYDRLERVYGVNQGGRRT